MIFRITRTRPLGRKVTKGALFHVEMCVKYEIGAGSVSSLTSDKCALNWCFGF